MILRLGAFAVTMAGLIYVINIGALYAEYRRWPCMQEIHVQCIPMTFREYRSWRGMCLQDPECRREWLNGKGQ
jgi:hypothetical protein